MIAIELSMLREPALISIPPIIAHQLDIVVTWVLWLTSLFQEVNSSTSSDVASCVNLFLRSTYTTPARIGACVWLVEGPV